MTIRIALLLVCLGLFGVNVQAQLSAANNEIPGFQFSTQDKVKDLTLLVSGKDDVMAVFGKDCLNGCSYNDDWVIDFAYVSSGWSTTKTENGANVVYRPKPEFLDKLASISFRPKQAMMLPESVLIPTGLKCNNADTTTGTMRFKSRLCTDNGALSYVIFDETDPYGKYQKNQIHHISYGLTHEKNSGIFAPVKDEAAP